MRMKRKMLNTKSGRMVSKRKNRLTTPSSGMSSRIARTAFLLANVVNRICTCTICYFCSVRNARAIFRAQNDPTYLFISSLDSAYREVLSNYYTRITLSATRSAVIAVLSMGGLDVFAHSQLWDENSDNVRKKHHVYLRQWMSFQLY